MHVDDSLVSQSGCPSASPGPSGIASIRRSGIIWTCETTTSIRRSSATRRSG